MFFEILNDYFSLKIEQEKEYFIFSKLFNSKLIKVVDYSYNYYFFIDKNNKLFNLKYSKEVYIKREKIIKLVYFINNNFKVSKYEIYLASNNLLDTNYYNVIFNYSNLNLSKEVYKYDKRLFNSGINFNFEQINKETLSNFYNLYLEFSKNKGFKIQELSFFQELFINFKKNFYILNSYNKEGNLIGSTILLRFNNKIILMYGGYDTNYIKKGLKYIINKYIIDYYKNDNNIDEIVFGTGKIETDLNDSILKFKSKFGDLYILNKIEGFL